jgi:hypothetical protein
MESLRHPPGASFATLCRNSLREKEWLEPESNRRHEDFQSSALPTELSSRRRRGIFISAEKNASGFFKTVGVFAPLRM